MTIGQRIAQKRKELGLSQEGLGEQLGVSRQAIYKWESDASLPEIDKLITLSKIFSVPVGWLLGVEEEPAPAEASPVELTEQQLAMVQEIVDRYLAAQPKPLSKARRRLFKWAVALGALCLVVCLSNLFSKLDQVSQDYSNLSWSVDSINRNVNSQIGSITSRVEDILKSQNALTAEWSAELASTDLAANTATFAVRVVPKTYVEGMTAVFQARSGEDTVELPVEPGADHAFAGQVTCPLTDDISLTVVFVTGDKRETQWLEDYDSLYTSSFPNLQLVGSLWSDMVRRKDNLLPVSDRPVRIEYLSAYNDIWNWEPEPPAQVRVGLFQDQKLVLWYEQQDQEIMVYGPNSMGGKKETQPGWYRPRDVELDPDSIYSEVLVYTDEYGRQRVYPGDGLAYDELKESWLPSTPYADGLTDWEF